MKFFLTLDKLIRCQKDKFHFSVGIFAYIKLVANQTRFTCLKTSWIELLRLSISELQPPKPKKQFSNPENAHFRVKWKEYRKANPRNEFYNAKISDRCENFRFFKTFPYRQIFRYDYFWHWNFQSLLIQISWIKIETQKTFSWIF